MGLSRKIRVSTMKFTDVRKYDSSRYSPRRLDYILAGAGHLLFLVVGLISFSSSAEAPAAGDNAIMVTMVSTAYAPEISPAEETVPAEIQEVSTEAVPVEETPAENIVEEPYIEEHPQNPDESIQETDPQEIPEEVMAENPPEENPVNPEEYISVNGEGSAGAGTPGPGTFESRVFNAVRRGYRTSVEPDRSYRVILTVNPDGTTSIEVIRKSGTSAFDRAVENALERAQIPPMPPGRSSPAVINIEFLGPER